MVLRNPPGEAQVFQVEGGFGHPFGELPGFGVGQHLEHPERKVRPSSPVGLAQQHLHALERRGGGQVGAGELVPGFPAHQGLDDVERGFDDPGLEHVEVFGLIVAKAAAPGVSEMRQGAEFEGGGRSVLRGGHGVALFQAEVVAGEGDLKGAGAAKGAEGEEFEGFHKDGYRVRLDGDRLTLRRTARTGGRRG